MSEKNLFENTCNGIGINFILNLGLFFLLAFLFNQLSVLFPNLPFIITKCLYLETYNKPLAKSFAHFQVIFGSISIAQIFYLIPLIYWLKKKRNNELRKGIIIGAILTTLLTSSCFMQVITCKSYN